MPASSATRAIRKTSTRTIPPLSRLLATAEAEQYARCSRRTLYRWAEEGSLSLYKLGRRTFWSMDQLDALVTRTGTPR